MTDRGIESVIDRGLRGKEGKREEYPYLVVMLNVGVYAYVPIRFMADPENVDNGDLDELKIACEEPFVDGALTDTCKHLIIEEVGIQSSRTNLQMCIVLGRENAIYVTPNGRITMSDDVPSDHIRI